MSGVRWSWASTPALHLCTTWPSHLDASVPLPDLIVQIQCDVLVERCYTPGHWSVHTSCSCSVLWFVSGWAEVQTVVPGCVTRFCLNPLAVHPGSPLLFREALWVVSRGVVCSTCVASPRQQGHSSQIQHQLFCLYLTFHAQFFPKISPFRTNDDEIELEVGYKTWITFSILLL